MGIYRKKREFSYYKNTIQERIWTVIRMQNVFNFSDIQVLASDGVEVVREDTLMRYLGYLEKVNYVKNYGKGYYKLLVNTGSKSPTLIRAYKNNKTTRIGMYDPNLKQRILFSHDTRKEASIKHYKTQRPKAIEYIRIGVEFSTADITEIVGSYFVAKKLIRSLVNKGLVEKIGEVRLSRGHGSNIYKYIGERDEK